MNCAYKGKCLLSMVISECKCTWGREFPFSSGQENPVSSEATTNSMQSMTRQGIHGESKKGSLLSPPNTSPKLFYVMNRLLTWKWSFLSLFHTLWIFPIRKSHIINKLNSIFIILPPFPSSSFNFSDNEFQEVRHSGFCFLVIHHLWSIQQCICVSLYLWAQHGLGCFFW